MAMIQLENLIQAAEDALVTSAALLRLEAERAAIVGLWEAGAMDENTPFARVAELVDKDLSNSARLDELMSDGSGSKFETLREKLATVSQAIKQYKELMPNLARMDEDGVLPASERESLDMVRAEIRNTVNRLGPEAFGFSSEAFGGIDLSDGVEGLVVDETHRQQLLSNLAQLLRLTRQADRNPGAPISACLARAAQEPPTAGDIIELTQVSPSAKWLAEL